MTALVGLGWNDARQATVWLQHWHAAKRRLKNGKHTNSTISRYAVSEVLDIGFLGRVFLWDKEFPLDEHGDPEKTKDLPQPPYKVHLDQHGTIWCSCMASVCKAPQCRHCDATIMLLEEGAFTEELQGV
jgi:hypothetical protein